MEADGCAVNVDEEMEGVHGLVSTMNCIFHPFVLSFCFLD